MKSGADQGERFTGAERLTLAVVMLASALMAIDMMIVTVALPQIGTDLPGSSLGGLQWVVVGYSLAFGALIQPAGSLSDRIGSRRMFIGGIALFTAASLACGLAPDMGSLIAFRVLKGAAAAVMFATAMPLLARTFTGQRRAMAIALWVAITGITSVASPVIGGLLVDAAGWRSMFLINVPLGIASVVVGARVLVRDERHHRNRARFDLPGAILLILALTCVNYGITLAQDGGWSRIAVLGWLGVAVASMAFFVFWELRASDPVLDVRLLADRSFLGVSLLAVINRIGTVGATVYLMIYLQSGHGLTPTSTGLLLVPLGLASFFGSLFAGRVQARVSARAVLIVGFLLLASGAALIGWQSATVQPFGWMIPATLLWGFGNALANTPLMAIATAAVPLPKVGMATGLVNSFFPLGATLGTVLFGNVFLALMGGSATSELEVVGGAVGAIYAIVAAGSVVAAVIASTLLPRVRT